MPHNVLYATIKDSRKAREFPPLWGSSGEIPCEEAIPRRGMNKLVLLLFLRLPARFDQDEVVGLSRGRGNEVELNREAGALLEWEGNADPFPHRAFAVYAEIRQCFIVGLLFVVHDVPPS